MGLVAISLIGLSLSTDCFAVVLAFSVSRSRFVAGEAGRVSLAFGFFQFLMPVLGWLAGRTIVDIISAYDHWVAFLLLAIVGGRMVWESFHGDEAPGRGGDISRGILLLTLAVATSIDALAVGLSLALLKLNILLASTIFGVVTFLVTGAAFLLGRRAGKLLGERSKLVGGLILIAIGIRIVLEHTV
ncbi:MAG: manganese efflux pump MntP family protein [Chloroflexota bacterium]